MRNPDPEQIRIAQQLIANAASLTDIIAAEDQLNIIAAEDQLINLTTATGRQ